MSRAIKISDREYALVLHNDVNTSGHTQWYYFKAISRLPPGTTVKFQIVNLMKPDSLYNSGMRPFVFSRQAYLQNGKHWHRDGQNMRYFRNNYQRLPQRHSGFLKMPTCTFSDAQPATLNVSGAPEHYYSFAWEYTFRYQDDSVFFAHCAPYSYSQLNEYLYLRQIGHSPTEG